jgi:hypothetical protein
MIFIYLTGSRDQAKALVEMIHGGDFGASGQIRLLGVTLTSPDPLPDHLFRSSNRFWPFIAENEDDEVLIRLAW